MGTYYMPVNLDKREYFFPHRIGYGLKWREQLWSIPSLGAVLLLVLYHRWNGDRIRWISDAAAHYNDGLDFHEIEETWTDISAEVRSMMNEEWGGVFVENRIHGTWDWTVVRPWNG